jgi:hypothetical protein
VSSPPFAGFRVVLAAKFNRRYHQSGAGIRAGLEQLGCDVVAVELRDRGADALLGRTLAKRLERAVRRHRPRLVLSYKASELSPAIIERLRQTGSARWVNWFPDSPHNLELSLSLGAAYDHVYLFGSFSPFRKLITS